MPLLHPWEANKGRPVVYHNSQGMGSVTGFSLSSGDFQLWMIQACSSLTSCYIFPISHSLDKFWVLGLSRLALRWKRMKSRRTQSHHRRVRASWSLHSSKYLGTHQKGQGLQEQQPARGTSPCGNRRSRKKPGGHSSPCTCSLVCTLLGCLRGAACHQPFQKSTAVRVLQVLFYSWSQVGVRQNM